jgi:hypothetical protein
MQDNMGSLATKSAATANHFDISGPLPADAAMRINNDFYRDKEVRIKKYPQR